MKFLLVTAVIATFVLALLLQSGSALVCYDCPVFNCDKNITCQGKDDTCIIVYFGAKNISGCWELSNCNLDYISKFYSTKNFNHSCCQSNLCNSAPNVVTSKIVLSGAFCLTVVHMLKSLI